MTNNDPCKSKVQMKKFAWNCGGETVHIIMAENEIDAQSQAILWRMKWTGEHIENCEYWCNKNDSFIDITDAEELDRLPIPEWLK